MNTSPSSGNALQKEQLLFKELIDQLINALLNSLFDLRPAKAARRMSYLILLFLLTGTLLTLYYYPLNLWAEHLQKIFLYLLTPNYATNYVGEPFSPFFNLLQQALLDPHILQYFPIFLAPIFIALHLAALYLQDIFELDDVSVARHFVWGVALSGSNETIRIAEGRIVEQYLQSPSYLIGGPGKVIVEFDSVALFERADGTPHVIGPTGKEQDGKATIDGFERFRQAIDIRDQHLALTVSSRSQDGIPVAATDVRLVFSIDRGDTPQPSPELPYPFNKDAIEKIVYKSSSKVTPDRLYPSNYEFSWTNSMPGLIRGKLSNFMSERNLVEYLANISTPEFEKLKKQEEEIAEKIKKLIQPNDESVKVKDVKPPSKFVARNEVKTNLFDQFTTDFRKSARNGGMELHWVGIGTWTTPSDIDDVSEQHLKAWELSQKNLKDSDENAFKKIEAKSTLEKMEDLIRSIPLAAYYEIVGPKKQASKRNSKKQEFKEDGDEEELVFSEEELIKLFSKETMLGDISEHFNEKVEAAVEKRLKDATEKDDRRAEMRMLLLVYRDHLSGAVQLMNSKNETVPAVIVEAIDYINRQYGHWVKRSRN